MRVLTVGGGSGGHVTPVRAIINELKRTAESGDLEIRFWSDRRFAHQARSIISPGNPDIKIRAIFSGKLRRYHGTSLLQQLLDMPTLLKNIGDVLLLLVGCVQSFILLAIWRPDVIFTKGGFVCLPVGVAAKLLNIPFVIHDSDAHPGLTNRILAPWARAIVTGAPLDYYDYPKNKTKYVGIPLDFNAKFISKEEQQKTKDLFGVARDVPLVVITGGGLGAERINKATLGIASSLLKDASIVHITGAKQFEKFKNHAPRRKNYKMLPFVSQDMSRLLGAADVVVTRAGATTMMELALLERAAIVIPNDMLTGGHQTKNAQVYQASSAAIIISEDDLLKNTNVLLEAISGLLSDDTERKRLGKNLSRFAKPKAAHDIVKIITGIAMKEKA